jgi:hypothetical protein
MKKNFCNIGSGLANGAAQTITAQPERQQVLPIWVRAPKNGLEYYTGCSRAKLYAWARAGLIRSRSIRESGADKGVRLFHLQSVLDFIEGKEASN